MSPVMSPLAKLVLVNFAVTFIESMPMRTKVSVSFGEPTTDI